MDEARVSEASAIWVGSCCWDTDDEDRCDEQWMMDASDQWMMDASDCWAHIVPLPDR